MSKHTPEPWEATFPTVRTLEDNQIIADCRLRDREIDSKVRKHTEEEVRANARRIVACVNACKGIPTEALERGVVEELVWALKGMLRISQLDMTSYQPGSLEDMIQSEQTVIYNQARQAIAKAESGKK